MSSLLSGVRGALENETMESNGAGVAMESMDISGLAMDETWVISYASAGRSRFCWSWGRAEKASDGFPWL